MRLGCFNSLGVMTRCACVWFCALVCLSVAAQDVARSLNTAEEVNVLVKAVKREGVVQEGEAPQTLKKTLDLPVGGLLSPASQISNEAAIEEDGEGAMNIWIVAEETKPADIGSWLNFDKENGKSLSASSGAELLTGRETVTAPKIAQSSDELHSVDMNQDSVGMVLQMSDVSKEKVIGEQPDLVVVDGDREDSADIEWTTQTDTYSGEETKQKQRRVNTKRVGRGGRVEESDGVMADEGDGIVYRTSNRNILREASDKAVRDSRREELSEEQIRRRSQTRRTRNGPQAARRLSERKVKGGKESKILTTMGHEEKGLKRIKKIKGVNQGKKYNGKKESDVSKSGHKTSFTISVKPSKISDTKIFDKAVQGLKSNKGRLLSIFDQLAETSPPLFLQGGFGGRVEDLLQISTRSHGSLNGSKDLKVKSKKKHETFADSLPIEGKGEMVLESQEEKKGGGTKEAIKAFKKNDTGGSKKLSEGNMRSTEHKKKAKPVKVIRPIEGTTIDKQTLFREKSLPDLDKLLPVEKFSHTHDKQILSLDKVLPALPIDKHKPAHDKKFVPLEKHGFNHDQQMISFHNHLGGFEVPSFSLNRGRDSSGGGKVVDAERKLIELKPKDKVKKGVRGKAKFIKTDKRKDSKVKLVPGKLGGTRHLKEKAKSRGLVGLKKKQTPVFTELLSSDKGVKELLPKKSLKKEKKRKSSDLRWVADKNEKQVKAVGQKLNGKRSLLEGWSVVEGPGGFGEVAELSERDKKEKVVERGMWRGGEEKAAVRIEEREERKKIKSATPKLLSGTNNVLASHTLGGISFTEDKSGRGIASGIDEAKKGNSSKSLPLSVSSGGLREVVDELFRTGPPSVLPVGDLGDKMSVGERGGIFESVGAGRGREARNQGRVSHGRKRNGKQNEIDEILPSTESYEARESYPQRGKQTVL